MAIGRMDVVSIGSCGVCNGKGLDPRNRKNKCPGCLGSGNQDICNSCGEPMPCPGTRADVIDQQICSASRNIEIK